VTNNEKVMGRAESSLGNLVKVEYEVEKLEERFRDIGNSVD